MGKIKALGCTTVLITEQTRPDMITRDEVSEFVCDGLVVLKKIQMGTDVLRTLSIEKMRETQINTGVHTMVFTPTGLVVKNKKA